MTVAEDFFAACEKQNAEGRPTDDYEFDPILIRQMRRALLNVADETGEFFLDQLSIAHAAASARDTVTLTAPFVEHLMEYIKEQQ